MSSTISKIKIWIREYFRGCPNKKNFTINDPPLMIIGHRGSPSKEPENTLPSFESALMEGANGLEMDLCITKDKQVLIWHDWDPNDKNALLREAGFEPWVKYKPHPPSILNEFRKPVNELTLEEFRNNFDYKRRKGGLHLVAHAYIPTLEEFYTWAADKNKLQYVFLDIKAPESGGDYAVEILSCIKQLEEKYNPQFKIILETTYESCFREMKNTYPEFSYSLDIEPPPGFVLEPSDYSALNTALKNNNNTAINLRPRKVTIANWTIYRRIFQFDISKLKHLRKNGNTALKLIAGTVSKRKELRCLIRLGVDGIQTDFPARLRRIAIRYNRKISEPEHRVNVIA